MLSILRSLRNPFIWKTAWRDSRTERRKLLLFASAIIMGVAALVSVNSFGENLLREVDNQAKSLLAADIVLTSRTPISERVDVLADSLGIEQSLETNFTSMVLFPRSGGTRLSQIRAIRGNYPFYGEFETEPAGALSDLQQRGFALVDEGMMIQYALSVGDSIRIGEKYLIVRASILGIPGESAAASLVGPRVYMSLDDLDETGLIRQGSIASWKRFWKTPDAAEVPDIIEAIRPTTRSERISVDTVEERRQGVNAVVGNVTRFLNVIGFLALLLGAVGIASSIHVYVRRKLNTVAILRCIGLKSVDALLIFLIQTMFFGFLGTVIGVVLGMAIQMVLPFVIQDFLPVDVEFQISWFAAWEGLITGFIVTVIFSLLPLLGIRKVSPLSVLRADTNESGRSLDVASISLLILGIATMIGFAIMQTGDVIQGLLLSALITVAIIGLAIVSIAIIATSKRINTSSWSYVWRQGLANLYRPRNQTFILVLSLGLGTTLIMTQVLIQHNLLEQVSVVGSEGQPNLIMFDVQTDQLDGVKQLFDDQNLPVMFEVPVVTMRISSINGVAADAILRDSSSTIPRWTLNREYRSTYRKELVDTETLLSGTITSEWSATDRVTPIPITLEEDIAADLNVSLGDSLTIDVQGVQMKTIIGGIRKVDWQRVQPNFFIVFPDGPLNTAPQFHVLVSRTETREASASIQRAVVENYPNVSAVDLDLILATIQSILDKAAFVIRFMALFSIVTGLIVLAGSVIISKYQRIRENVLLRTIGASRKQIIGILLAEYTFLSMSAALAGLILSGLAGWSLSYFVFDGPFSIPALTLLSGWLLLTTLTLSIAWLNSRNTLNRPPLEVLREEL